ncbi:MAG: protein translocase subunit SecD, partial [Clostridia bacterium]|nr:protein translocase subunit SecD [Clostridia bacterium]
MKLRKSGKLTFFVVLILILALTFTAFFGIENYYGDTREVIFKGAKDIRWGIDIKGGVEAVFSPNKEDIKITGEDMDAAKAIIETRLVNENITDYEVYTDSQNHQIIVRFPWEAGESDFDAVATVEKLGTSAVLVFRKGTEKTGEVVLKGAEDVKSAYPAINPENNAPIVGLELTSAGTSKFAAATSSMTGQQISIWLSTTTSEVDEQGNPVVEEILLSAPTVNEPITNGQCTISGSDMTAEYVKELSEQINSGKLPFALTVDDSKLQIISPTLGSDALRVMLIAGSIAFGLVCLLMILRYRLNGFVAAFALLGQLAGSIACISGYFASANSFTLTVPGIAGIILSVGVGVDCNVIAAERIRDEFQKGKTIDGAIDSGFKNSLNAIIDGNVTIVIVSLVLMGAFGSPDGIMAKIMS